ncbi:hypothetical protein [Tissierella sp.]|uniref:hypothetical protein n=1 Tax=Tissierella sp. TaxID=41274 RepID=UPI0028556AC8|nr:hypothetical protein [Tissierella sp.]MDR7856089.1 hypothetical protein [Tissierella sp.]
MNEITRKMLEDRLSFERRNLLELDMNINQLENRLSEDKQRKNEIVEIIEALETDLNWRQVNN